jgi:hypothetical protein
LVLKCIKGEALKDVIVGGEGVNEGLNNQRKQKEMSRINRRMFWMRLETVKRSGI